MENIENKPKKIIRISVKKFVVFVIIVGIIGLGIYSFYRSYNNRMYGVGAGSSAPLAPSFDNSKMSPEYYPMPYQNPSSVKDTREFMKVAYGAEIKTRDVKDIMRDVKSAIRDAEGRMDNLNESDKFGFVSFVVPKSNFDDFRDEIESLANEKLISLNISSENLLTQKQQIEEQNRNATASLTALQKSQKDLTTAHNITVNNLQTSMNVSTKQLSNVRKLIASTSDENELAKLRTQETNLTQNIQSLQTSLNNENSNFNANNQNLKNQIDNVNAQLKNIKTQDENFTDNIETVNGSISVQWVSLWKLAKIFSPISPVIIIIILLIAIWYFLMRKNYLPSIEFV